MAHGINANLARRWVVQATQRAGNPMAPGAAMVPGAVAPAFIPVHQPPAEPASADIRIELRRGATAISVSWPCEAAAQCAAWMRRAAAMIRIDAVWLAVHPTDMRAGADRLLAKVVQVFGAAQAHHGYLFVNARSTRIKLLVHDGFGLWCAARRLNKGAFEWPRSDAIDAAPLTLSKEQFDALVLGLPWQRLEQMRRITRL